MNEITSFIERFGFPIAVVVFYLWRDIQREKMQNLQNIASAEDKKNLQSFISTTLVTINERMITVMMHNTEALNGLKDVLGVRPCVLPHEAREAAEKVMSNMLRRSTDHAEESVGDYLSRKESGR